KSMESQEAIFSLYNAPHLEGHKKGAGVEVMDMVMEKGGVIPALKIMAAVIGTRIKLLSKGLGDIPLSADVLDDIKKERQGT
ncbi:MAG: hypothetical protein V1744_02805, partial [Candidatus Altiarchaeota archaeon]